MIPMATAAGDSRVSLRERPSTSVIPMSFFRLKISHGLWGSEGACKRMHGAIAAALEEDQSGPWKVCCLAQNSFD